MCNFSLDRTQPKGYLSFFASSSSSSAGPPLFLPVSPTLASSLLETTPAWINALPSSPSLLSCSLISSLHHRSSIYQKKRDPARLLLLPPPPSLPHNVLGKKNPLLNYMAGIHQDRLQRKVELINKYCSKLKIGGQRTLRRPCVNDEDPSLVLLHPTKPRPSSRQARPPRAVCGADVKSIRHERHAECLIMCL